MSLTIHVGTGTALNAPLSHMQACVAGQRGKVAHDWMEARAEDLLPVEYFHVVFKLPAEIAQIAYANKAVVYDLLFKASSETLLTIAADPKHLDAKIGVTSVLHTWGSAMTHHLLPSHGLPSNHERAHVHVIIPGGGLSPDGERWIACRPGFFLPVRVLSRLYRRLFLEGLIRLHQAGKLNFFGNLLELADPDTFAAHLSPLRRTEWVVYAKKPFGGPEAVLAYLSRYTHKIAISNSRLISADAETAAFKWKDYRAKGRKRHKIMRLATDEFIRRFLIHVLPSGFHRIRHTGFLANGTRRARIAQIRERLNAQPPAMEPRDPSPIDKHLKYPCPECGGATVMRRSQGSDEQLQNWVANIPVAIGTTLCSWRFKRTRRCACRRRKPRLT